MRLRQFIEFHYHFIFWKSYGNFLNRTFKISVRFNGHFPGGPGLAGTRLLSVWISLELRMMEVVVTAEATRRSKLHSNRRHQQTNTHTHFLQARCPSCSPTNSVSTAGKKSELSRCTRKIGTV